MEFADVVRTRRMVRRYDPHRDVPRAELEILLNLAIRAPSAGHTQGWRFLVLNDITSRDLFWSTASTGPADEWRASMSSAPVLIVCYADRDAYIARYHRSDKAGRSPDSIDDRDPERWQIPYWDVDTGMAALTLMLSAHDRGLSAGFFGVPVSRWDAVAQAFAVPDGLRPVGVVSLGYASSSEATPTRRARPRRPVAEVAVYNRFDHLPGEAST